MGMLIACAEPQIHQIAWELNILLKMNGCALPVRR